MPVPIPLFLRPRLIIPMRLFNTITYILVVDGIMEEVINMWVSWMMMVGLRLLWRPHLIFILSNPGFYLWDTLPGHLHGNHVRVFDIDGNDIWGDYIRW